MLNYIITFSGVPVISQDPVFQLISKDPMEFTRTCTSTCGLITTTATWTTSTGNDDTFVTELKDVVSYWLFLRDFLENACVQC